MLCALLFDAVPIYPLYSLLFAASGLSSAQISALFVVWCVVGIAAQVPTGALADRFSRRAALIAAGFLQAGGYALWVLFPHFIGFAAGFVAWGLGGSLYSGAMEALLYEGLRAHDAQAHYTRVWGLVTAVGLVAALPAAGAATALFGLGGFRLVGWASVVGCGCAGLLAARLPEAPKEAADDADELGYLATVWSGLRTAIGLPGVRLAILAVAALTGIDGVEEYFPLLAQSWGVPVRIVPAAIVAIPLLASGASALSGPAARLRGVTLGWLLGAAFVLFGVAALVHTAAGLGALAIGYALYRLVEVVANGRLQERIEGAHRATVTSVAGLGSDVAAIGLYAVWPLGGLVVVAALGLLVAVALPRWLRVTASRGP